ncbi:hypothetical protein HJFPF1_09940 [Paramyrothecium foliicola]|nr:hypothetical protein HJFPF1_09940 [Paramyrothecium foliicola]
MSEHWKSTPRYWCKHCSCYVRDTKLERQNHEATGKHQGALKRFLRDLHRGHEREERDKDRAKQEIARLNGVVAGSSSASTSGASFPRDQSTPRTTAPSDAQLKRQREQLIEMGVAAPDTVRPEMAVPGEWTVTQTRIIEPKKDEDDEDKVEKRATGVRKREVTEEDKEEEDAVQGLFKKPRRWGRDSKLMAQEEDEELDALLNGSLVTVKQAEDDEKIKQEPDSEAGAAASETKAEEDYVKPEPDDAVQGLSTDTGASESRETAVKNEDGGDSPPPVVFRKRKAKGLRQK